MDIPKNKKAMPPKIIEKMAQVIQNHSGLTEFTIGQVHLKPGDFKEAAQALGKGIMVYTTTDELNGLDAINVTYPKGGCEIYLRPWNHKGDNTRTQVAMLLHELTHFICNKNAASANKFDKEAACYVAQVMCSLHLKSGMSLEEEPIKSAQKVVDLIRHPKQGDYTKAGQALAKVLSGLPQYVH